MFLAYKGDNTIIPKNTTILVQRTPITKVKDFSRARQKDMTKEHQGTFFPKSDLEYNIFGLTDPNVTSKSRNNGTSLQENEENRIRNILSVGNEKWNQQQTFMERNPTLKRTFKLATKKGPSGIPPPSYTCYRCCQKGHYYNNCPKLSDVSFERPKIKKTTGIPKSFLKPVSLSEVGSGGTILMTSHGELVKASPNETEWNKFLESTKSIQIDATDPSQSEICSICNNILNEPCKLLCCDFVCCENCIGDKCYRCERQITTESIKSLKR